MPRDSSLSAKAGPPRPRCRRARRRRSELFGGADRDQPGLRGHADRRDPRAHTELSVDPPEVRRHGALADAEPRADDKVLSFEGGSVRVFIDPKSYLYLDGSNLVYATSMLGRGFKFENPNIKGSCGCGASVQF